MNKFILSNIRSARTNKCVTTTTTVYNASGVIDIIYVDTTSNNVEVKLDGLFFSGRSVIIAHIAGSNTCTITSVKGISTTVDPLTLNESIELIANIDLDKWVVLNQAGTATNTSTTATYNAGTTQNLVMCTTLTKSLSINYSCVATSSQQSGIINITHNGTIIEFDNAFNSIPNTGMLITLTPEISSTNIILKLINNTGETIEFTYTKELR